MEALETVPLARAGGLSLSPGECLAFLRKRGHLRAVALQALADKVVADAARDAGLSVSDDELQQAGDRFRRLRGLGSADRTRQWLARQGRSALDFEAALEHDLLAARLKDHLTRDRVAGHFEARRDDYARARLRVIAAAAEDLARELLSQLRDDGRDFAELARQHSLHPSRADGGALGDVWRGQIPAVVANAVFVARPGDVVGPLALAGGVHLFLVEEVRPPELDDATRGRVRDELFDRWLADRLLGATFTPPGDP